MKTDRTSVTERKRAFVDAFMVHKIGTKAAIAAGFSPKSAHAQATDLLKDPEVQAMIQARSEEISAAAKFEAVDVLRHWIEIVTADPTKISRVRRVNCRHCWGHGFEYQWKTREYAEACDRAMNYVNPETRRKEPKPMPKCDGGFGFAGNRPPNPDCPECDGEGVEDTFFEDMSNLGQAERRLIASVKRTKDGLEVKMRDQSDALARIATHLGLLVNKTELTGKNGGPVAVASIPVELPADLDALAQLYKKVVGE